MTPNHKSKFKQETQTRTLTVLSHNPTAKRINSAHYVEGYAARYEPYVLYYDTDGQPIYERFERGCFDGCDMSDIIYQYDHAGRVLARTSNGSLLVEPDDCGLFVAADLGRTEAAREHYSDVAAGMVRKMSWRFRVGEYYYDHETRTIVHTKVAKVYDVSGVSIPANDNTVINARTWVDKEIFRKVQCEDERRRKLRTKINNNLGGTKV